MGTEKIQDGAVMKSESGPGLLRAYGSVTGAAVPSTHYGSAYNCNNCGRRFMAVIPKGIRTEHASWTHTCGYCGVQHVHAAEVKE